MQFNYKKKKNFNRVGPSRTQFVFVYEKKSLGEKSSLSTCQWGDDMHVTSLHFVTHLNLGPNFILFFNNKKKNTKPRYQIISISFGAILLLYMSK